MLRPSFKKAIQLTSIALAFALIAGVWVLVSNYLEEQKELGALKRRWLEKGKFLEISKSSDQIRSAIVASVVTQKSNSSSQLDESDLADLVMSMFDSFRSGSWDRYRQFHFPIPAMELGGMNTNRMAIIRNAYGAYLAKGQTPVDEVVGGESDEDLFIRWGTHLVDAENHSNFGHACWTAVDIRNISFSFVQTNKVPSLHGFARTFEQLSGTSVFESIVAFPKLNSKGLTDDSFIYAQLRVPVAMSRGKIGGYPVYAQFCWMPSKRKWVPTALALPTTERALRIWF